MVIITIAWLTTVSLYPNRHSRNRPILLTVTLNGDQLFSRKLTIKWNPVWSG